MYRALLCCFMLHFCGCATQQDVRKPAVVHSLIASHPDAAVEVNNALKAPVDGHIKLLVGYRSKLPVSANVFVLAHRGQIGYSTLLGQAIQPHVESEALSEIYFSQHMRDFPDAQYLVIELVVHLPNYPAPVVSAWVLYYWDKVFLWNHQEAFASDGSYQPERGFYLRKDGAWVKTKTRAVLKRFSLNQKVE